MTKSTPAQKKPTPVKENLMPKLATPLSEDQISNTKAKEKPFKLFDGNGLYLLVTPLANDDCSKYWRFNYRFKGKRKTLALGVYPTVALNEARIQRDDALRLLSEGVDPSETRREEKLKRKADKQKPSDIPSVRFLMDGEIEIRKGRTAIRLTNEESHFVTDLLNQLR